MFDSHRLSWLARFLLGILAMVYILLALVCIFPTFYMPVPFAIAAPLFGAAGVALIRRKGIGYIRWAAVFLVIVAWLIPTMMKSQFSGFVLSLILPAVAAVTLVVSWWGDVRAAFS